MVNDLNWTIFFASYYITFPKKGKNNTLFSPMVTGNVITPEKIPNILIEFFNREPEIYPVGITFSSLDGTNPIREMVVNLANQSPESPSITLSLAERLCHYMDNKSNSGLVVTLCGKLGSRKRIVILKFPQEVILHPENEDIVQVNEAYATEYGYVKAVVFEDQPSKEAFWKGRVEDKENSSIIKQAASYWIYDFLNANTDVTDYVGTKILSGMIKETIDKTPSLDERTQLIASFESIKNNDDLVITIDSFIKNYLPTRTQEKFISRLKYEPLLNTPFRIIPEEANKLVGYESLELDNGIIIIGPEQIMKDNINDKDNQIVIITGKITNKRLRAHVR